MKKISLVYLLIAAVGIGSCSDNDDPRPSGGDDEIKANTSSFATERPVKLEIDYSEANAKVLFSVYEENPLVFSNNSTTVTLRHDIRPLDGAWTDENGHFSGEMILPAYVKEVYIVTNSAHARTCMKGIITNDALQVSDGDATAPVSKAPATSYRTDANRFDNLGWITKQGYYNPVTGAVKDLYTGNDPKLTLSAAERRSLNETVNSVLGRWSSCPADYRTASDLYVNDNNTEVVLTVLNSNTCWNSSLGYYYYKDGQTPSAFKQVKVYTIFPNTQMYWKSDNYSLQSYPQGVTPGDAVKLLYYDDPAHPEGTDFPAGYRIGFVLACNSWNTYFTGYNSYPQTTGYFSASTQGLSSKGINGMDVHTAMFKDKATGNIAIAFEDFKDDQNFTDVIFSVKSNPVISNVPEVDKDKNTAVERTGIYAFEDLWPAAGDYDMNDVLTQYTYRKTFNMNNRIVEEAFTFKTFANSAGLKNGLAFQLTNAAPGSTSDFIRYNSAELFTETKFSHEEGNVVKLTDDVRTRINAEYRVVVNYGKNSSKLKESGVNAFIYRDQAGGKRLEVHCPMQRPTARADESFFGTFDDRSQPDKGIYYISDKNNIYPFAFYLSNAGNDDIAPLLDPANEKKAISLLYPRFINWATTGSDADWYKK